MAEINARQLLDANGEVYYPFTDVTCVNGIPDDIADFDIGNLRENVISLSSQIKDVRNLVNNIVTDTGWSNVSLLNGAIAYSSDEIPQVRMISVNDVTFVSLRGSVKGLTTFPVTIGKVPTSISNKLNYTTPFIQNTSLSNDKPTYTRIRVNADGNIIIERTSQGVSTTDHWFPINFTFMV